MPTVCPPQFLGLEFTEKVAPHEALAIPRPIEVYRLDGAPRAQSRLTQLALADTVSDQEETFDPGAAPPAACGSHTRSLRIQSRPLRQFGS
jgi:hypothetical protein